MSDNQLLCVSYEFQNKYFNIEAPGEIHTRLQNDPTEFEAYVLAQGIQGLGDAVNEPTPTVDISVDQNLKWSKKITMLLVSAYKARKEDFRNPKIKKKTLWSAIKEEFRTHGYTVTEDELDRKWRNLKKTYTGIKDNKKSTGRGRIAWEYFEEFQEIYIEDQTINLPLTISAFPDVSAVETPATQDIPRMDLPGPSQISFTRRTASTSIQSPNFFQAEKKKPTKSLYAIRKRLADIEDKRVEELRLLRLAVERSNIIQQERNDLLRSFLERNHQ